MMNIDNLTYNNAIFAAANGYGGFRSDFSRIFQSEKFERIYVLKGGPGTGKSTLMKGMLLHSPEKYHKTAIFCSSDPGSLDGVILQSGGRKIAILDGTSPHERDAVIPGAIDEIINLADGFARDKLVTYRDEILRLNRLKSAAYRDAYSLLSLAGKAWESILSFSKEYYTNYRAEMNFEVAKITEHNLRSSTVKAFYTSSFGKFGYYSTHSPRSENAKIIDISGGFFKEQSALRAGVADLAKSGTAALVHISPLDPSIIERITTANTILCASSLPTSASISTPDNESQTLFGMHSKILEMAKDKFSSAADYHFKLEDIYSSALNFSHNDAIFERLAADVEHLLEA